MKNVLVILNPRSGRGGAAVADRLSAELKLHGLEADMQLTRYAGHAVELASTAASEGCELVVAAGGDGTVHEVVNGLLGASADPEAASGRGSPVLGIVPIGSGCDYARTFGIPPDITAAARILASEHPALEVDVGEVTAYTAAGQRTRLFVNIAEVGLGPAVVERAERLPRRVGGVRYLLAFWLRLPTYTRPHCTVSMDGQGYDGPLTNLVAANARVFGGGMRIAPDADPCDGQLDIQIHWGSKADYVANIPKVYRGTHLPHPKVRQARAKSAQVSCNPHVLVEVDGEVVGTTPATFGIRPAALRLKTPESALGAFTQEELDG